MDEKQTVAVTWHNHRIAKVLREVGMDKIADEFEAMPEATEDRSYYPVPAAERTEAPRARVRVQLVARLG